MNELSAEERALPYCYLTTTGRTSGEPRRIEIWFGTEDGRTIYLLAGGREKSHWIRNARAEPRVTVEIGERTFAGMSRPARDDAEDALARRLLLEKYSPSYSGELGGWGRTSLPLAIDLEGPARA
jgi:deazaflavin-dependent oxidoreductase (nitroreductase family)